MNTLTKSFALLIICGLVALPSYAQTTATQDVTVIVSNISAISASAGSLSLTINSATPGSDPTDATNSTTSYSVTTNESNKKITAALDALYSDGISLAVQLTAPTGGSSAGSVTLTTTAQDVVTSITQLKETGLTIAYTASALVTTDANGGGETNTVTFTITD